ncbi:unnamed protein product [Cylicocyclus nassatus]|uniref:Homologous-pairing protein 2 winged helix domain-containing protein n=1 Tax=Cylicocyclus nassatus TaxID=53992 RepID=A0AA36M5R4_CYLNA|nr:unnamed protein product [Cylicocyclus nassatus]
MAKAELEEKAFEKIQEYMIEQNRPYSSTDVYTNLRQEFGKQLVLKVLEASVVSGVLKEKVIGKQKIFYVNQDKFEKYDDSAIADYDRNIDELTTKKVELSSRYRELQSELKELSSVETTERLQDITTELKEKVAGMKAQLAKLESDDNPVIAEEGRKAVEMEASISKSLRKRKAIATNMLNAICECSTMKKRELLESIGVDSVKRLLIQKVPTA